MGMLIIVSKVWEPGPSTSAQAQMVLQFTVATDSGFAWVLGFFGSSMAVVVINLEE